MRCLPYSIARARRLAATVLLTGSASLLAGCDGNGDVAITASAVKVVLPEFDRYVHSVLERSAIPGMAIGVVFDGEVLLAGTYGISSVDTQQPVTADTVFPVASVSKAITSSTLAILSGAGELAWDDPVSKVRPGVAFYQDYDGGTMSYRDLMSQRTGLGDHYGDLLEMLFRYDRPEIFRRLAALPPVGRFRQDYAYSNWNATLAGDTAARASGYPAWEDLVADRLFRPLGMTSSSARFSNYLAAPERAANHQVQNGSARVVPLFSRDASSPGGGANSTLNDLLTWVRFLLAEGRHDGRQITTPQSLHEVWEPVIPLEPAATAHYGLGWVITEYHGMRQVWHNGGFTEGINTLIMLLPEQRLGLVILTNAQPMGAPEALSEKLLALVFGHNPAHDWWPEKHAASLTEADPDTDQLQGPPPEPEPPLPLSAYVGTYAHPYFGEALVTAVEGQLWWQAGSDVPRLLEHWQWEGATDLFRLRDTPVAGLVLQPLRFLVQDDVVQGLTLPLFDAEIPGAVMHRLADYPENFFGKAVELVIPPPKR